MHTELHHEGLPGDSPQDEPEVPVLSGISPVFYLPLTRMSVSRYAELTGQKIRTVQQQINRGRLPLSESVSKERQINILSLFLQDYAEAVNSLKSHEKYKGVVMNNGNEKSFISYCLHDELVNVIASFESLPVKSGSGSCGAVIRLIEVYYLQQLKNLSERYSNLTGYDFIIPEMDKEELDLIMSLLDPVLSELNNRKTDYMIEADKASNYLSGLRSGIVKLVTTSDLKSEGLRCEQVINSNQILIDKVKNLYEIIKNLKHMASALFKNTGENKGNTLALLQHNKTIQDVIKAFPEVRYVTGKVEKLQDAFTKITAAYTDGRVTKYDRDGYVPLKRRCAQKYYGKDGVELRNQVAFMDYYHGFKKFDDMTRKDADMSVRDISVSRI